MTNITIADLKFDKVSGLIPVVVQDATDQSILMLAYANRLAVEKTLETGSSHFWSRSRNELWNKGATSGNLQEVKEILVDCDADTLVYIVNQKGVACHTGNKTCFFRSLK
ncbi:MAG: phosphoribosyl-AMP cyclohydrolase [Nitrososphaerales archaeon]|nr:phosphoribosyl-AMP cyclohydrolase [Nitrososphaerota archaeon]